MPVGEADRGLCCGQRGPARLGDCPEFLETATAARLEAAPPARLLRPGPGFPDQKCGLAWPASLPPDGGRDARPAPGLAAPPTSLASATHRVRPANFDPAFLEKGTLAGELNRLFVIVCAEHVKAADDFFGFAIRSVDDTQPPFLQTQDLTPLFAKLLTGHVAAGGVDLVDPGLIALDLALHFFRRYVPPNAGRLMQDQHELGHDGALSFTHGVVPSLSLTPLEP